MSILAVDLAARYSAACWLADQRYVLTQWDSWQKSEADFLDLICSPWQSLSERGPYLMVVEDLPFRLPYRALVRDVARLQGRIVDRMDRLGRLDQLRFVTPSEWRKHYPELAKRGSGAAAVAPVAHALGYSPPDLTGRLRGERGEKAVARKVAGDYSAAYLIARWALERYYELCTLDLPGTTRYGTTTPAPATPAPATPAPAAHG